MCAMATLQHVYVTAHGSWASGPWLGESAQFGIRCVLAETGAMPAVGETFTPMANGDVTVESGTEVGTNGTLTKTWTARRGPTGSTENADAGFQIDLAEDVRTFLNTIKAYQRSTWRWTHVKMSPIDATGKTVGVSSVYTFTTALAGSSTNQYPPQIAMAISLRANIVGRRGRGRFYLPGLSSTLGTSDGTINPTDANAIRAAAVTLINNIQNVPGTPDYIPLVAIMSAGSATAVRPAEVRTGSRFDTIRSRREQVPETYTATAL